MLIPYEMLQELMVLTPRSLEKDRKVNIMITCRSFIGISQLRCLVKKG